MNRERKREERQWLLKKRQWESFKHWPVRESNWNEFLRIINRKSKKMRTTSEGWSTKLQRRRENWLESLKSWPERATWMKMNCFSLNKKLIMKEENLWLINKKYKKWNKFWIQAVNRQNKKLECWLKSLRSREEKVWLTKRELKICNEHLIKKSISWTNWPEENLKTWNNLTSFVNKLKRKGIRV